LQPVKKPEHFQAHLIERWLIHRNPAHPHRQLATKALRNLRKWGIDLLELKSHLQPVAKAIGRKFAERLIIAPIEECEL